MNLHQMAAQHELDSIYGVGRFTVEVSFEESQSTTAMGNGKQVMSIHIVDVGTGCDGRYGILLQDGLSRDGHLDIARDFAKRIATMIDDNIKEGIGKLLKDLI